MNVICLTIYVMIDFPSMSPVSQYVKLLKGGQGGKSSKLSVTSLEKKRFCMKPKDPWAWAGQHLSVSCEAKPGETGASLYQGEESSSSSLHSQAPSKVEILF